MKKPPVAWDAWSKDTSQKTTDSDKAWRDVLEGKPYMMAVSPWFYTNLPSKNWLWKGDSLWYTRWEEVLSFNPEYVEVSTLDEVSHKHGGGDSQKIFQDEVAETRGRSSHGMIMVNHTILGQSINQGLYQEQEDM